VLVRGTFSVLDVAAADVAVLDVAAVATVAALDVAAVATVADAIIPESFPA